uniref:Uncharacterized protein n=1 Tax=Vitis vinifera TaxID=29760 RepID=F6HVD7_VITVI
MNSGSKKHSPLSFSLFSCCVQTPSVAPVFVVLALFSIFLGAHLVCSDSLLKLSFLFIYLEKVLGSSPI